MEGDSAEYSVYNLRGGALVWVATMQADASHGPLSVTKRLLKTIDLDLKRGIPPNGH
jgi:hypothetical protein